MPVSVVVGGQFGSEGKGKVALDLARRDPSTEIAVRPGGSNSGHTGYSRDGRKLILRQLPAAAIDGNLLAVLPAGSYVDVDLLEQEIQLLGLDPRQVIVDPRAHVITEDHRSWERKSGLTESIGSTGSGTGAAVLARIGRFARVAPLGTPAAEVTALLPYLQDASAILGDALIRGKRVVIEGTQGYGLSPIHGDAWPKATSRDTTAAAFLSETGLSPFWVDQIVLVLRSYPIRVAGDSGPLLDEVTWEEVQSCAGATSPLQEFTSVTHKLRRVGRFDAVIVRKAIAANRPTNIVLNHLDHIDARAFDGRAFSQRALDFLRKVERDIGDRITQVGTSPQTLISVDSCVERCA